MSFDWLKATPWMPLDDIVAWHTDDGDLADDGLMPDVINGRHLVASTNKPTLLDPIADVNGQRGWSFDGTVNPLVWTGAVTLKHVFMVVSIDAEPSVDGGLLTGVAAGEILVVDASGAFATGAGASYRNDGIEDETLALPTNPYSLVEVVYEDGVTLDGLQIGQQLALTDNLLQGKVLESLAYSAVKGDWELMFIHRYIATRYHIWEQTVDEIPIDLGE